MPGAQPNPNQGENPFLDKVGARVLPDFLSISENPTISQYQNWHLSGFSKIDEDGVPSREVKLVENGMLKALLDVARSGSRFRPTPPEAVTRGRRRRRT